MADMAMSHPLNATIALSPAADPITCVALFADVPVDGLAEDVSMTGVPGGLFYEVQERPSQRESLAV